MFQYGSILGRKRKYKFVKLCGKNFKGDKNVLLLSTVEPILGTTKDDEAHKPALYKLYDFSKGGTDIVDQKIGNYTVKSKSRKWTNVALAYLLHTIRVNSSTLLAMNDGKDPKSINSFNFGFELATDLVMPHIDRRSRQGLSLSVLQKISSFYQMRKKILFANISRILTKMAPHLKC